MGMKSIASIFLCLIGAMALTACAQPAPTPVSKPVEIKKEMAPPVATAAPANTQNTPSAKESKPMIDIDNPPVGPAIPAAELKKQILALIGSLQSREHTNQENVEKQLGVKMYVDPEWDLNRMYWGQTTEGWRYWFSVTKLRKEPASAIDFRLFHGEKTLDDALPKTCTIDAEAIVKKIDSMGFQRSDELIIMDGKMWWGFRKNIPAHNARLGVEVHVYRAENSTENGRLCVKQIDIGMEPLHE
jgi:hypothetical protein